MINSIIYVIQIVNPPRKEMIQMKKAFSLIAVLLLLAVAVSGCVSTRFTPVSNGISLNEVDFLQVKKSGESCASYILGFIGPFGEYSLKKAIDNGRISKVDLVEYKNANFIIVSKECVEVYGH